MSDSKDEKTALSLERTSTSDSHQASWQVPTALLEELKSYIEAEVDDRVDEAERKRVRREFEMAKLWDAEEASHFLGVSTRTVHRLARSEELDSTWIGGQRRFFPKAVENYARKRSSRRREQRDDS
jgi:excisionase family DNA binding protein